MKMIAICLNRAALLLSLLLFGAAPKTFANALADPTPPAEAPLELGPNSTLQLDGDSTLHKYSAKAAGFSASFELKPGAKAAANEGVEAFFRSGEIASVELMVPVAKLSSGESGLDSNLRKALGADAHRHILFHISSYVLGPPSEAGALFSLKLHGSLEVAGVEKEIDVVTNGFKAANNIRLVGNKDIVMSDYKVQAPVLMLGMLKTKDLINIKFDLTIARKS